MSCLVLPSPPPGEEGSWLTFSSCAALGIHCSVPKTSQLGRLSSGTDWAWVVRGEGWELKLGQVFPHGGLHQAFFARWPGWDLLFELQLSSDALPPQSSSLLSFPSQVSYLWHYEALHTHSCLLPPSFILSQIFPALKFCLSICFPEDLNWYKLFVKNASSFFMSEQPWTHLLPPTRSLLVRK